MVTKESDDHLVRFRKMSKPIRVVYARPRTFAAFAIGIIAFFLLPGSLWLVTRLLIGWDFGAVAYLIQAVVVIRRFDIKPHLAAEKPLGAEAAEDQVGVGHGGFGAAERIAGGRFDRSTMSFADRRRSPDAESLPTRIPPRIVRSAIWLTNRRSSRRGARRSHRPHRSGSRTPQDC